MNDLLAPGLAIATAQVPTATAATHGTPSFIVGGLLVLVVLFLGYRRKGGVGGSRRFGFLYGEDGRRSTSKLMAFVWLVVLVGGVAMLLTTIAVTGRATLASSRLELLDEEYVVLVGAPLLGYLASRGITESKVGSSKLQKPAPEATREFAAGGFAADDRGQADFIDIQYISFNTVLLVYFVGAVLSKAQVPELPATLVALTGVSAAGYIAEKAIRSNPPTIAAATWSPKSAESVAADQAVAAAQEAATVGATSAAEAAAARKAATANTAAAAAREEAVAQAEDVKRQAAVKAAAEAAREADDDATAAAKKAADADRAAEHAQRAADHAQRAGASNAAAAAEQAAHAKARADEHRAAVKAAAAKATEASRAVTEEQAAAAQASAARAAAAEAAEEAEQAAALAIERAAAAQEAAAAQRAAADEAAVVAQSAGVLQIRGQHLYAPTDKAEWKSKVGVDGSHVVNVTWPSSQILDVDLDKSPDRGARITVTTGAEAHAVAVL